ncbi:hypothetical protein HYV30_03605 [Candidatus Kaiserbacteria bacterium]|nr:hypothetical protein [Candidatus Kaiserbacteria bacterium]
MRQIAIALSLLCLVSLSAPPANAEETPVLSYSFATEWWAKYLNQGGFVIHDGSVLWTSLFVTHNRSGFYAGLWNSTPIDGTEFNSDFGTENDIYLGWRGRTGNFGYTLGVAYFDLYRLGGDPAGDLMQAYGEVAYHFPFGKHELVPFARLEYSIPPPVRHTMLDESVRGLVGVRYTYVLTEQVGFWAKLWLIGDDGRNAPEATGIAQLDGGVKVVLTQNVNMTFGARLSQPMTKTSSRKFEAVPNAALNINW